MMPRQGNSQVVHKNIQFASKRGAGLSTRNQFRPRGRGDDGGTMNEIASFDASQADIQSPETMPHSVEAEQQLLGAILTNNDVYDRIASIIGPQHFYDPVHARIYDIAAARVATRRLAGRGRQVSLLLGDPSREERLVGVLQGLREDGSLAVRLPDGRLETVYSGEIIPSYPPEPGDEEKS